MTDIAQENRKLRSAQHQAALDLDLALAMLKNRCPRAAALVIERAAARLYREAPALKREADAARPVAA